MQARFVAAAMALGAMLAGCSINQKAPLTTAGNMCNFVKHELTVDIPSSGEAVSGPLSPFAQVIESSLAAHDNRAAPGTGATMLFLSGGSQNGAFGAGILTGWGGDGDLPDLQVVTGTRGGPGNGGHVSARVVNRGRAVVYLNADGLVLEPVDVEAGLAVEVVDHGGSRVFGRRQKRAIEARDVQELLGQRL